MNGCRLHGFSFTYGCPGCEAVEDAADLALVRHRTRWWRRSELCARVVRHWWKTLEPDVARCRICKSLEFRDATFEQLKRHLAPGAS